MSPKAVEQMNDRTHGKAYPGSSDGISDRLRGESLYLRLSITESCAFGCPYCQPKPRHADRRRVDYLSPSEIGRVVRALGSFGVTRVRLTGGEPLSRPDCRKIIEHIREIEAIREVSLTTNGRRLEQNAAGLHRAGLNRVNVHLDTLREERFKSLGGRGDLNNVLRGIESAQRAGLNPVKINTVLMRGINSDELLDFCEFALTTGITVRFIEMMDTGPAPEFVRRHFMSALEARERIEERFELAPRFANRGASPAREFLLEKGRAVVGFISSQNEPFCAGCNRFRLTADGVFKGCLYESDGLDLRSALRVDDYGDELLRESIAGAMNAKRSHHPRLTTRIHSDFSMAEVGG